MGVKIWRRDGLVAFASDPALIGQSFVPGEELREAWAGELNASFDKLEDDENARERDAGVPLLEVYNPVHSIRSGEIIAVAEFYIRADELAADIRRAHAGAWAVVAGVSAATFLALFGIVRAGSRTIAAQTRALTGQLEELRRISAQNDALRQRVQAASRRGAETSERYMRRISAELHDGPAQALALASLRLDALMRRAAVAQDDPEARNLRAVLDEALGEVRALCRGLALPELEGRGLGETLEMAVGAHERRTGTAVARDFADSGMEARLPHPVLICLYRVVQEGLMNAWRHAPGAPVMVAATCRDGQLSVTVLDRGPGFDPAAAGGGLGLAGLRERAESLGGEFALDTAPGAGTRLAVALPQEALG